MRAGVAGSGGMKVVQSVVTEGEQKSRQGGRGQREKEESTCGG